MTRGQSLLWPVLAIACLTAACVYEPTQVTVQVGTNLPPSVPLRVRATIRRGTVTLAPDASADYEWTRAPNNTPRPGADGGIALPASFAIVPPQDGPRDEMVTLVVEGRTEHETLRRTVRFRLVPHQPSVIRVFLAAQCLAPDARCTATSPCTLQAYCEETGRTCGDDGACVGVLQTVQRDAGAFDGGCVPYCDHAACGDPDGCGGTCLTGACGGNGVCQAGHCVCGPGEALCGASCLPAAGIACQAGQSQSQPCGSCGTQTRACDPGCTWGAWGPCAGEGVCAPGAADSAPCGNCGTQSRTCTAACAWGGYGACGGQGCAPGSTQQGACDSCQHQTCTASCTWSACGFDAGAVCTYVGGTHSRSCAACTCGRQYCLSSCVWSTACVSFCGGANSGACRTSCPSGC